ncbi:Ubiquitin domain [Arabidopsis suecica]|uniref:Ubiquitin domain n=1 Tax=Arabidopsis suecica TaxID=45249 RepID=A0A8T1ZGJ0_ARASU|nr:Ubiquitin domain [Arabidopsis suecica]
MDVYFETQKGTKFCNELGYWDTVLEIKKKIEKYQRISVPRQTLFFRGKVLEDDLDIEQCKILQDSRVLLFVSPDPCDPNDDNDQVLQTEESPIILSNSIEDLIYGQDLPLTTEVVLKIRPFCPVETDEITYVQDSPVKNNDQAPPSDAAKQIINGHQDSTVTAHQELQTKQSPPSDSVRDH